MVSATGERFVRTKEDIDAGAASNNWRENRRLLLMGVACGEELTVFPSIFLIDDAEEVEIKVMPISATRAMNAEMRVEELSFERWEPLIWDFIEFLLKTGFARQVCALPAH
jgi:hypothetical protein